MPAELSADLVLSAYYDGLFPMADPRGRIALYSPDPRGVLELDHLRISRSLRKVIQRRLFEVKINADFAGVITACADRPDGTWISPSIREAYIELHTRGWAHSVETWRNGRLAGGLYGIAIGAAFFGESMFHRETDASKVALVALVNRLKQAGYTLLDVQFLTPHLERLGATEISRETYLRRLDEAVKLDRTFAPELEAPRDA